MADMINFTLPKIDEGSDKQTLKQIKNYLFQLAEQMRYYLNNIDSDNFTEEYYEKMSHMVDTGTSNSKQMDKIQQREHRIINEINTAKDQIARTIANNKGGYIIFNDTDDDELPDELIICDRPNLEDADRMWRWNLGGLMYNDGGYIPADDMVWMEDEYGNGDWYEPDPDSPSGQTDYVPCSDLGRKVVVGIDMNGNINASAITTGKLTAIEIRGLYGEIGGWDILSTRLEADNTSNGGFRSGMQAVAPPSSAAFYAGCSTAAGGTITSEAVSNFYVTQGGYLFSKSGKIGGWTITSNILYSEKELNGITYTTELRSIDYGSSTVASEHGAIVISQKNNGTMSYPFVLRYDGSLSANNAVIRGDITATSGNFSGNITLGGSLSSTRGDYTVTVRGVQSSATYGVIYIADNSGSSTTYPFFLRGNGELIATKATITGTVNATSGNFTGTVNSTTGNIGGWTLNESYIQRSYTSTRVRVGGTTNAFSIYNTTADEWELRITDVGNIISRRGAEFNNLTADSALYINYLSAGTLTIGSNHMVLSSGSSKRFKENISSNLSKGLNPQKLYNAAVVEFDYKEEHKNKALTKGKQIGFIAEDLADCYKPAVVYDENDKPVNWSERIMIPAMLKLIQEQHMEIENLKRSLL